MRARWHMLVWFLHVLLHDVRSSLPSGAAVRVLGWMYARKQIAICFLYIPKVNGQRLSNLGRLLQSCFSSMTV